MNPPNPAQRKSSRERKLRASCRILLAFVVAVTVTYIAAATLVSQWNIASVEALGLPVSLAERGRAATHDIGHMIEIYLPLIAIGFLVALPVAWLLSGRGGGSSRTTLATPAVLFPLAGFVALITIHIALKAAFDVSAVAPTRTIDGLLGQALAGALGGYTFYRMAKLAGSSAEV